MRYVLRCEHEAFGDQIFQVDLTLDGSESVEVAVERFKDALFLSKEALQKKLQGKDVIINCGRIDGSITHAARDVHLKVSEWINGGQVGECPGRPLSEEETHNPDDMITTVLNDAA